ncbi:MAG TPA: cyclic nucleotide-binding domain-containing protein [Candidatus Tectomicrobia bacterium]
MNLGGLFVDANNVQEFQANSTIFVEGAPGDVMYVVLEGEVELLVHSQVLEVAGPGDLVGEMALIDAKPRSATARAKSDCRLAPVDERRFLFLVHEHPFFALHVMRVLTDRLRRMDAEWKPPQGLEPRR